MNRYIETVIAQSKIDVLKELYRHNPKCYDPFDALVRAAKRGHIEMVRYLTEEHKVNLNDEGEYKLLRYRPRCEKNMLESQAALRTACINYDVTMVTMLHEYFHYPGHIINWALAVYCEHGCDSSNDSLVLPPIRYLISQGANINLHKYT